MGKLRPVLMSVAAICALATLFGCNTSSAGQGPQGTQYKLTVLAGGGGSASPVGTAAVGSGTATPISATPFSGCSFVTWTVTAGSAKIANAATAGTTVTLSTGDATVVASFAVNNGSNFLARTGSGTYDASLAFRFVRIDRPTGNVSAISADNNNYMTGLAFDPSGTHLYGISDHLYTISLADGTATPIHTLDYGLSTQILMCAAAMSPTGFLYVLENAGTNPRLFTVNLTNGVLSLVGTVTVNMRSIAFAPDGTLYGGFFSLYKISTTDASTTLIGSFGGAQISSCRSAPPASSTGWTRSLPLTSTS